MSDEQYRLKNPVCAGRQEPNSKFPAFAPATAGRQMSNCKLQTTGDRLPITDYQLLITKILKFILLTVLIIMLFDHYFLTMSFGIYLFWLILGLNQAINNQSSS